MLNCVIVDIDEDKNEYNSFNGVVDEELKL